MTEGRRVPLRESDGVLAVVGTGEYGLATGRAAEQRVMSGDGEVVEEADEGGPRIAGRPEGLLSRVHDIGAAGHQGLQPVAERPGDQGAARVDRDRAGEPARAAHRQRADLAGVAADRGRVERGDVQRDAVL